MAAARKSSRDRDASMILIGYRHGLRAFELCDLQWQRSGSALPFPLDDENWAASSPRPAVSTANIFERPLRTRGGRC
jgi:hypothetical protein